LALVQIHDWLMNHWLSSVVCGLYVSMALFFGVMHDHRDHDHCHDSCPAQEHKDCAACAWQLNAVTDVPNVLPLIFASVLETRVESFDFTSYLAPSFSFSPSRAPPAALA
jgi:hypothetical protein